MTAPGDRDLVDASPFADLLVGNVRAAENHQPPPPSGNPRLGLAVLTCIDSRIDPLRALGLVPGDAKILRNAGARVTDDVERTLAAATAVLGVTRIAVVAHTDCKMAAAGQDDVAAAVAKAAGVTLEEAGCVDYLTVADQSEALRRDVGRLRACTLLPSEIPIAGFVLDLTSGLLHSVL